MKYIEMCYTSLPAVGICQYSCPERMVRSCVALLVLVVKYLCHLWSCSNGIFSGDSPWICLYVWVNQNMLDVIKVHAMNNVIWNHKGNTKATAASDAIHTSCNGSSSCIILSLLLLEIAASVDNSKSLPFFPSKYKFYLEQGLQCHSYYYRCDSLLLFICCCFFDKFLEKSGNNIRY